MKRIVLFVLTNVAVLAVLTIVLRVFGLDRIAGLRAGQLPLAAAAARALNRSLASL